METAASESVRYIDAGDGCMLWTATSGAGPATVLCHGGPGMWDYLGPLASMIDDGATVHRWDQRGCGRSGATPPFTTARFIDDLEAVRRQFGHEQWVVGGHSWGAQLALKYALRYPDRTRALVYISGTGIGSAWRTEYHAERLRRLASAGAEHRWNQLASDAGTDDEYREYCELTWMTDYADPSFGREQARAMLATGFLPNRDVNAQLNVEQRRDQEATMAAQCRTLALPALILHGSDDPRAVSATDSLLAALPTADRVIIDGAGHLPWVDQPEPFARALRGFLSRIG